jgi:hypothetical protein
MFYVSVVFTFDEAHMCRLLCILCLVSDQEGFIWKSQIKEDSRPYASVASAFYVASSRKQKLHSTTTTTTRAGHGSRAVYST